MATHRWLTLAAAIVIVALECWAFTDASAVASAAGSSNALLPGNDPNDGRALYSAYCAACHQANGEGTAGVVPALRGSAVVNRSDASKHIDVVLGGLQGARVSGVTYVNPMPPFAAVLSDAAVAAIIDYERGAWGNDGARISPSQVASERARLKPHP